MKKLQLVLINYHRLHSWVIADTIVSSLLLSSKILSETICLITMLKQILLKYAKETTNTFVSQESSSA